MESTMIVAATDFSYPARAAADRAALIARESKAKLTLVYAFDETSWKNLRALATPKEKLFTGQPAHQAWEKIRAEADQLSGKHGIVVSGVIATGKTSEVIASTATAVHASLIVLGPHGGRLGDWVYLGSTALGVARMAACPVLVVRNRPTAAYARCLVGADFSPPSQRAAAFTARCFPSTEITLLHAVQSVEGPMLFAGASREAIKAAKGKLRQQAVERLAKAFPAGQPGCLDQAPRRVVAMPAVRALMRELDSGKFDLLALGRDASAVLAERLLGSVPANMLMNSPTDVLIVP